jgi:hypothetical protein
MFPGTLEEYYAAREIHRRELSVYRRQPEFILGLILFGVPLLILAFSNILPTPWKLLLLPVSFGYVCLVDTATEHYALLLLRRSRESTQPGA